MSVSSAYLSVFGEWMCFCLKFGIFTNFFYSSSTLQLTLLTVQENVCDSGQLSQVDCPTALLQNRWCAIKYLMAFSESIHSVLYTALSAPYVTQVN